MVSEKTDRPWIIAHRGARDEAPENTLAAFRRALAYPVDGIELDVQLSADGVVIVFHDWTLKRVCRIDNCIHELTSAQVAALDGGAWFHEDFKGERLPELDNVLKTLAARSRWLIEIKAHPSETEAGRIFQLTDAVLEIVENQNGRLSPDLFHILSFDPQVLSHAAERFPDIRYVLNLPESRPEDIIGADPSAIDHLWAVDAPISRLSERLARWARQKDLRLFTYTCNEPRQVRKALDIGVDGIISDRPGWLADVLAKPDEPDDHGGR